MCSHCRQYWTALFGPPVGDGTGPAVVVVTTVGVSVSLAVSSLLLQAPAMTANASTTLNICLIEASRQEWGDCILRDVARPWQGHWSRPSRTTQARAPSPQHPHRLAPEGVRHDWPVTIS